MGSVIKAGAPGTLLKRLERFELRDHMAEAQAVVEAARADAKRMAEQSKRKCDELYQLEFQRGHEEGYQIGREQGERDGRTQAYADAKAEFHQQQSQLIAALTSLIENMGREKEQLLKDAEKDLLKFALNLSERIVKRSGVADRQVVKENASAAIELIGAQERISVRVNPVDLEVMHEYAVECDAAIRQNTAVNLIEDASIEPGGCRVASPATEVDATIEGQFRQAVAILLGETGAHEVTGESASTEQETRDAL